MISYHLDPSLHSTQPHEPVLDDGFSPPASDDEPAATSGSSAAPASQGVDSSLWAKSAF